MGSVAPVRSWPGAYIVTGCRLGPKTPGAPTRLSSPAAAGAPARDLVAVERRRGRLVHARRWCPAVPPGSVGAGGLEPEAPERADARDLEPEVAERSCGTEGGHARDHDDEPRSRRLRRVRLAAGVRRP